MAKPKSLQQQADEAYRTWGQSRTAKKKRKQKAKALARHQNVKQKAKPRFRRPNYHEYIASKKWSAKRKQAFAHHGAKCNRCGATANLTVHHKTYARLGREKMKDLEILCRACHDIEHEDKGYFNGQTKEFLAVVG